MAYRGFVIILMCSVFLLSCSSSKNSDGQSLVPTIYYKPTIHLNATECSENELRDIMSPEGVTLATLCEADFKNCLLQGSCFVEADGKTTSYNYHSTKETVPRFIEVDLARCPFGYGVNSSCLDPYFTAAADLKYYKMGDVIFIPRMVGAEMPNGEIHDGYVIIRDSGGAIIGPNRFDFFTGFLDHKQKSNTLARLGFGDPKNSFEFRRATEDEAKSARERRNFPGLKKSVLRDGSI